MAATSGSFRYQRRIPALPEHRLDNAGIIAINYREARRFGRDAYVGVGPFGPPLIDGFWFW